MVKIIHCLFISLFNTTDVKTAVTTEKRYIAMELSNFARIGKGVITKAIGLQENYIDVFEAAESKLDEEKSGCAGCPVCSAKHQMRDLGVDEAMKTLESRCRECPQAVFTETYTEKKKYINEKNRFGYQETLKSNALKLLMVYHFLNPNACGLITDISIKGLAETVGCTAATVRASNRALSEYGYCYVCESGAYDGCISILLPEYRDYHKTAAEGGRGYITMSEGMVRRLLNMHGVNTLRLNLKGILEVDSSSSRSTEDPELASATATFKKLRGFLPDYCKRNVIVRALEQDSSIFSFSCSDKAVTFSINREFAQKNVRGAMLENEEAEMKSYITKLNQTLFMAGKSYIKGADPLTDARLSVFRIAAAGSYTLLALSEKDYKDLASMCIQYSRDNVRKAVTAVYNDYILHGTEIRNFGGVVRTAIRAILSADRAAA